MHRTMSYESSPYTTDEHLFDQLSAIHMDPLLQETLNQAVDYNEYLSDLDVSREEVADVVRDLDEKWSALLGSTVVASGQMVFPFVDAEGEVTYQSDLYDNEEVLFGGAYALPLDPLEEEPTRFKIGIEFKREALLPDGRPAILDGIAKPEDVLKLEFPTAMSLDRARSWLEYYYPDAIDDIDMAVLNEADNECDQLLALADVKVRLPKDTSDVEADTLTSTALRCYTRSFVMIDEDLPYQLEFQGAAWTVDGDSDEIYGIDATVYGQWVRVDGLIWKSVPGKKDAVLRPHLMTRVFQDDKTLPPDRYLFPLQGVRELESLRYLQRTTDDED